MMREEGADLVWKTPDKIEERPLHFLALDFFSIFLFPSAIFSFFELIKLWKSQELEGWTNKKHNFNKKAFLTFHRLDSEVSINPGPNPSADLDKLQLRATLTFQIIFQTFIILMGIQHQDTKSDRGALAFGIVALACGVLAIAQVVLQAIFIETLQQKV